MNRLNLNTIRNSFNVITGCGSGLGRATLQWFLKNDSGPILAIDRSFPHGYLKDLDISDNQRNKILLKTHDTFDQPKTEASLAEFVSRYGRIDNVINVAGVALAFQIYSKGTGKAYLENHAKTVLEFNTLGTFNVIRLASKHMIEDDLKIQDCSRTKCIINVSCLSTNAPSTGQTFYVATKAAIDSMTLCIARELSPFRIRCNTINVGYFDTKLLRASDARVVQYLEKISLCPPRLGLPDEFAHLTQAIIENQMLNGCCIKLDAGAKEATPPGIP